MDLVEILSSELLFDNHIETNRTKALRNLGFTKRT